MIVFVDDVGYVSYAIAVCVCAVVVAPVVAFFAVVPNNNRIGAQYLFSVVDEVIMINCVVVGRSGDGFDANTTISLNVVSNNGVVGRNINIYASIVVF